MKPNAAAIGKAYRIIHVILNLCLWPRMIGLWQSLAGAHSGAWRGCETAVRHCSADSLWFIS